MTRPAWWRDVRTMIHRWPLCIAGLGLLALGGCGGGGGVVSTATPAATPTPATPPITPVTTNFDTAEYRRSNAAVAAQAIAAWQAGASGAGVTVAVIDSGVNTASSEFAGRISPSSRDLAGSRGFGDEDGHGTEVSALLLAARDGLNIQGVAYGATLLVLRADRPGSCAETKGCGFDSSVIAAGFDVAASAQARVVNLSLGGGSAPLSLRAAAARASAAGAVIVLSAGNDGNAEIDPFAAAVQSAAPGAVIVAGAIDDSRTIASYSNRAGVAAGYYLVTLGNRVRSFDHTGTAFLYSGTSEAAPVISGAAALLAQAYPTLTPAQIVDILLRSADDLGSPGTDSIYGRGALNIARAFAPIGSLSVDKVADPLTSEVGMLGSALGDAGQVGMALQKVAAHDSYDRDYAVDMRATLRRQSSGRLANALLGSDVRMAAGVYGDAEVAVTARGIDGIAWRGDVATAAERPRGVFLGGQTRLQLAPDRVAVLGFGQSAAAMLDVAGGASDGSAPLVALRASEAGLVAQPLGGGAVAQRIGEWTLGTAFGTMVMRVVGVPNGASRTGPNDGLRASRAIMRADRALGSARLGVAVALLTEAGTLLGSQFPASFGIGGAATTSVI
ncbi:MAG: S8 family serine peptidase, partial [Sandarakinorhabdus sp.]|nr:S8 family serine peptidase [Sandarakinorhabdus sp.]